MALSRDEIDRYKRHLLLHEIGGQGQQALKAARVLVVGAGGLGSPVLLYLAASGVGTLGIVDNDTVSLDNLQRQIVHDTPRIGMLKVESAKDTIARLNPHVSVEAHSVRLTKENAAAIISKYDIVADGSDNFATRYLVADTCRDLKKTLVFAAVGQFDGYVTTLKPHVMSPSGEPYPSYRCIFPEEPDAGTVPSCAEAGILGSVVGVVGTIQATEVIKELTGTGETLAGRLLTFDAKEMRFETFRVFSDPETAH